MPEALFERRPGLDGYFDKEVILGVRPSDFEDAALAEASWPRLHARADVTEALGTEIHVLFRIDAPPVKHAALGQATSAGLDAEEEALPLEAGKSLWTARVAARSTITAWRQPVELAVQTSNLQFFDATTGLSIGHPLATGATVSAWRSGSSRQLARLLR